MPDTVLNLGHKNGMTVSSLAAMGLRSGQKNGMRKTKVINVGSTEQFRKRHLHQNRFSEKMTDSVLILHFKERSRWLLDLPWRSLH